MRCRKVRSFLSAYCSGELDRRHNRAVSEHLLTCAACRREEAVYRQMVEAVAEVPQMGITEDFNSRLLNRIAQERFAETRTKAYMPKPAPLFLWRRVAPVLATFCLAVFVVFSGLEYDRAYDQGLVFERSAGASRTSQPYIQSGRPGQQLCRLE